MNAWEKLFDESPLARAARIFASSIQIHALYELGFEDHINDYEPKALALVATQTQGPMHDILYDEAVDRASVEDAELLKEARQ